jgi:hypothetical protein
MRFVSASLASLFQSTQCLSTGAAPFSLGEKKGLHRVLFILPMMVPRGAHICQLRTTHQGYAPKAPLSGVPRRDAGASSGKRRRRVPGDWGVERWLIFAAHNSKTSQVKPRSCGSVPAIRSPRRRPTSGSAKGPITASCHRDGRFRDRASVASAFARRSLQY